jgi:pyruvate dehydrogenase E1 component alpha subunit
MKNSRVNGRNVMDVYDAAKEALAYVRENSQPYLLEVETYRLRGHSMGDPERYRTPDEVEKKKETEPIRIFREQLISKKTATAKQLDKIEADVEEEIQKAVEFAENSPEPAPEALWEHVYVEEAEV